MHGVSLRNPIPLPSGFPSPRCGKPACADSCMSTPHRDPLPYGIIDRAQQKVRPFAPFAEPCSGVFVCDSPTNRSASTSNLVSQSPRGYRSFAIADFTCVYIDRVPPPFDCENIFLPDDCCRWSLRAGIGINSDSKAAIFFFKEAGNLGGHHGWFHWPIIRTV